MVLKRKKSRIAPQANQKRKNIKSSGRRLPGKGPAGGKGLTPAGERVWDCKGRVFESYASEIADAGSAIGRKMARYGSSNPSEEISITPKRLKGTLSKRDKDKQEGEA